VLSRRLDIRSLDRHIQHTNNSLPLSGVSPMKSHGRWIGRWAGVGALFVSLAGLAFLHGDEKKPPADRPADKAPVKTPQAWTLDEALAQLQLYPDDPYLQYVALQLSYREKQFDNTSQQVENFIGRGSGRRGGRRGDVDLFSVFTGALAVQESLQ